MIPSIPSLYELKLHKVYNVSGLNDLLFPFYYFQIMNNYIFFLIFHDFESIGEALITSMSPSLKFYQIGFFGHALFMFL